ncbi:hypothetical protein GCM10009608_71830 [Pseudonocardia alaniniphila]
MFRMIIGSGSETGSCAAADPQTLIKNHMWRTRHGCPAFLADRPAIWPTQRAATPTLAPRGRGQGRGASSDMINALDPAAGLCTAAGPEVLITGPATQRSASASLPIGCAVQVRT